METNSAGKMMEYVDKKTIAVAFKHQGYILDIDKYFVINQLLERNLSWSLSKTESFYEIFVPYLAWNSIFNKVADILTFFLTTQIVIIYTLNINFKMSKFRISKSNLSNITYSMYWEKLSSFIITEKFIIVLILVFLEITYLTYTIYATIVNGGSTYLSSNKYKFNDMRQAADLFKILIQIRSLELGFVIMRLFFLLMNSVAERTLLTYLIETFKLNMKWMFLMLPMYFILSSMGQLVLGKYVEDFGKKHTAFINVVQTSQGRMQVGNSINQDHQIVITYYFIQYVIGVFFTFNMYLAFGQRSYYDLIKKEGYHKEVIKRQKKSTFKSKNHFF